MVLVRGFLVVVVLVVLTGCQNRRQGSDAEVLRVPVTVQYTESEVTFKGAGGVDLVGTLMVPAGSLSKSYPCVMLISGSGPTDKNGNQPTLKPNTMKQIAVGLAGAEIASFRFDKRAVSSYQFQWPRKPGEIGPYFSWKNHVQDALAAWSRMKKHGLVDPDRCALLGHSEGGMIALSIANAAKPKALILCATPGRTYGALIHDQLAERLPGSDGKKLLEQSDQAMAFIKAYGKVPPNVPTELKGLYNPSVGVFLQQASAVVPTQLVKGFLGPILVVNGDSDSQVSPDLDAKALYSACNGRKDCEIVILPLASHNLKAVDSRKDEGIKGAIVPDSIEAIHRFLVPKIGGKVPDGQLDLNID